MFYEVIDLLLRDSPNYLQPIEKSLIKCAVDIGMPEANISHTALISAKTGDGVEDLISRMFNVWKSKGIVCTRNELGSLHRISTFDTLVRGKMVRSPDMSSIYNHSHRLDKQIFATLTNCDALGTSLMLLGKTGLRYGESGAKCHEECSDSLPKCGAKYPKTGGDHMTFSNSPQSDPLDNASVSSNTSSLQPTQNYYEQFQATIAETRTHEGYLYKRGGLFKGWKWWFGLASIKHQLRYYDAVEGSQSKGFIELSEVVGVTSALPTQGAPKKADEKAFFDSLTTRRTCDVQTILNQHNNGLRRFKPAFLHEYLAY